VTFCCKVSVLLFMESACRQEQPTQQRLVVDVAMLDRGRKFDSCGDILILSPFVCSVLTVTCHRDIVEVRGFKKLDVLSFNSNAKGRNGIRD